METHTKVTGGVYTRNTLQWNEREIAQLIGIYDLPDNLRPSGKELEQIFQRTGSSIFSYVHLLRKQGKIGKKTNHLPQNAAIKWSGNGGLTQEIGEQLKESLKPDIQPVEWTTEKIAILKEILTTLPSAERNAACQARLGLSYNATNWQIRKLLREGEIIYGNRGRPYVLASIPVSPTQLVSLIPAKSKTTTKSSRMPWTDEEISIARAIFTRTPYNKRRREIKEKLPGRSWCAVKTKVCELAALGLLKLNKRKGFYVETGMKEEFKPAHKEINPMFLVATIIALILMVIMGVYLQWTFYGN